MDWVEAWGIWLETHKGGLAILATIVSSIAAVVSAFNAHSSKITSDMSRHQNDARLVALDAKSIAMECDKIKRISNEVHIGCESLLAAARKDPNPRHERIKKAAAEKLARALEISEKAVTTVKEFQLIEQQSDRALSQMKVEFDLVLVELNALTDGLLAELAVVNRALGAPLPKPSRQKA